MTEGPHLESQADRHEGEEENWSQGCESHCGELLVTVLLVVVVVSTVYSSIGITITMHCLALSWAEGRVRLPSTRSTVRSVKVLIMGTDYRVTLTGYHERYVKTYLYNLYESV